MGTPREPVQLVRQAGGVRMLAVRTGADHTARMQAYAAQRLERLANEDLCGYVLKDRSPSCGLAGVPLYDQAGCASQPGAGLFAAALSARFPGLPLEEAGRLEDARVREHFLERVLAYRSLHDLFDSNWTNATLVRFHTAHKLTLMAHSITVYTQLGQLVARSQALPRDAVRAQYTEAFMAALEAIPTSARHVNVLQHVAGYFKRDSDRRARSALLMAIDDYRHEYVTLEETIALFRQQAERMGLQYLLDQVYLQPRERRR
jgi:uncharacterized protein YbgA (DUF1722 family)